MEKQTDIWTSPQKPHCPGQTGTHDNYI